MLAELEKQMKIENLFVTWQQRSAQSNMPISVSTTVLRYGLVILLIKTQQKHFVRLMPSFINFNIKAEHYCIKYEP